MTIIKVRQLHQCEDCATLTDTPPDHHQHYHCERHHHDDAR